MWVGLSILQRLDVYWPNVGQKCSHLLCIWHFPQAAIQWYLKKWDSVVVNVCLQGHLLKVLQALRFEFEKSTKWTALFPLCLECFHLVGIIPQ